MEDTDLISVVLTVQTAKRLLAALTSKIVPTEDTALAVIKSLGVALVGTPPQADDQP